MAEGRCQDIIISVAIKGAAGITKCSLEQCRDTKIVCRDIMKSRKKKVCRDIENSIATEHGKELEN